MATKLTKDNIKGVIARITKKGFRTKFWREYRASTAKGCGVAKALDKLEKLRLPETGAPDKVKFENLVAVLEGYDDLSSAFTKARSKCGKLQKQTNDLCVEYNKKIAKYYTIAQSLLGKEGVDLRAKQMIEEDKEKERKKKDEQEEKEILAGMKKAHEQKKKDEKAHKEEVVKQLDVTQAVLKSLLTVEKTCKAIVKASRAATKDIYNVKTAWSQDRDKEGASAGRVDTTAMKDLKDVGRNHKIPDYYKALKAPIPNKIKEGTEKLKKIKPLEEIKKTYKAAIKTRAQAVKDFGDAKDEIETMLTVYQEAMATVKQASEGPKATPGEGEPETR